MNHACPDTCRLPVRWKVGWCALLLGWVALTASSAAKADVPYSVRIWQTDEGLPQNSVHAIAQSSEGYLWVGTREGLARFDGVRFTAVDEDAAPELRQGWITALLAASDGSMWVACDGVGVIRFKDRNFTRFSETNSLPSNQSRCLAEGKDGSIWIGTEGGLVRHKDGELKSYAVQSGLPDLSIRSVVEDRRGVIRIATRRGLSGLTADGSIATISFGPGVFANALKAVCEDAQGDLWVTSNEGVTCLRDGRQIVYGMDEGLPDKLATAIHADRAGRVWVGTYGGVACFMDGKVVSKPMGEAGFGDLVYAIFEDRESNLWIGGRDGLYRLRPARFTTYTTEEGLSGNNVMSVCEDQTGALCLGIWGGGLNRLDGKKVTVLNTTNGLTHDLVLAMHAARDGSLWLGMDFAGGLNRLYQGGRDIYTQQEGLIGPVIRALHEDREGALWIGTSRGLSILRDGKFMNYTSAHGLAGTNVMVFCETSEGQVWVGTDGGLSRWDHGKFQTITAQNGLAHDFVYALHEDARGALWIGTKGGLSRLQHGKLARYTTAHGLFSNEIYEILEDDSGHFWMSCRKGVFRVRKQDLDELDRGVISRVTSVAFGKADGLASVQCNGVAKPAGWKARDGRLWFPTIRGVVAVDARIETNDQPPPVAIEEVVAQHRTLRHNELTTTQGGTLVVPAGHGGLEIRYTALSFQAPEKNRFRYRLEGADSGWIEAGAERMARYYNLAPGYYRFRVTACNNDGVWNETGATLAMLLQPHYWQTWWFKLGILVATGLLLTALYQVRVRRLREIENLRVQIAADLHDDVGARLTKVAMVTELLDRDTPAADRNKPNIKNIFRTTREVIQAMDEIVWTINPRNDSLENLANYIFQYGQDYFQDSGVRCRMDVPARLPEHSISTQQRHNLFMAVKEAMNNVLKHAGATEVRIGLAITDSRLTITVADNGCGFSPDNRPAAGDGLANMQQRMERIGGRLVLKSSPGGGTRVRLEVRAE